MAKVECELEYVDLVNERGRPVAGVRVHCGRCEASEESFGTGEASIKRCLVLLRENCPMGENNFYVAPEADDAG